LYSFSIINHFEFCVHPESVTLWRFGAFGDSAWLNRHSSRVIARKKTEGNEAASDAVCRSEVDDRFEDVAEPVRQALSALLLTGSIPAWKVMSLPGGVLARPSIGAVIGHDVTSSSFMVPSASL
jgi:hypothetical protein